MKTNKAAQKSLTLLKILVLSATNLKQRKHKLLKAAFADIRQKIKTQ